MKSKFYLVAVLVCALLLVYGCGKNEPVELETIDQHHGSILFNCIIGEDAVITNPADILEEKASFAPQDVKTGTIIDRKGIILDVGIAVEQATDGAADDIDWISRYTSTDEALFSETDFYSGLWDGTYRSIKVTQRNLFQWHISVLDSITTIDSLRITGADRFGPYTLTGIDGERNEGNDGDHFVVITDASETIIKNGVTLGSSDYTMNYTAATVTFTDTVFSTDSVFASYEYTVWSIHKIDALLDEDQEDDAEIERIYTTAGEYGLSVVDSTATELSYTFNLLSTTEKLGSNIVVTEGGTHIIVWRMNPNTVDIDLETDELSNWTYIDGSTGIFQFYVQ